ncbi:MAG: 2-oxoacid:acceptor oxidoreductase family protein, partial [Halanaerobiales bacterium]
MELMQELRWHGRGGQGAKTASILLAKIAIATGKYIQAFPEYGPERMGAPVLAYTRISERPIHQHCQVEEADIILILDPTLLRTVDVKGGTSPAAIFIINSIVKPDRLRQKLELKEGQNLYTVDADRISREEIGRVFPNTPMMGAFCKIAPFM